MIVLVRGNNATGNYADRITLAMASSTMQKYAKRVLVLQMTKRYAVEKVMIGKMNANNTLKTSEYKIDDTGMDALYRRAEIGTISSEQFSDCCYNIVKNEKGYENGFDIAGVSKKEDYEDYLLKNDALTKQILLSAKAVYDVVYVICNATNKELTKKLEEYAEKEVVCISQGPKKEYEAKPDAIYAVKNFDNLSTFTIKAMQKSYGVKEIYPVPYNIQFKDACLNEFALQFLSSNIEPDETDDNYYFISCMDKIAGQILGMEKPQIKETNFVYRKQAKR